MKFRANGKDYEFEEEEITFREAEALEEQTGLTMKEVFSELKDGASRALRAIVWLAVRRTDGELAYDDLLDWNIADLDFGDEAEEDDTPEGEGASPFES